VKHSNGQVHSAVLSNGITIKAFCWVDCTGNGSFSHACGAERLIGQDSQFLYNEPSAPIHGDRSALNGATLMFRAKKEKLESRHFYEPPKCWWAKHYPAVSCNHFPNGDLQINMLPTMSGKDAFDGNPDSIYYECKKRVRAQWAFMQYYWPEFRSFSFAGTASMVGLRETWRVVCDYMLNESDVAGGLSSQPHPDIIGITDHPFDVHGASGANYGELSEPYGIPYRCLIVKGFSNLLTASRCSGFSSIAASSCRLSRTMMQLGQAAGTAAALALELSVLPKDVPADRLRESLREQNVQLDW